MPLTTQQQVLCASIPNFRHNRLLTYCTIMASDLLVLATAGFVGVRLRHLYQADFPPADYIPLAIVLPFFLLAYRLAGLYPGVAQNPIDELRRVFHATTAGFLVIVTGTFLVKAVPYSRLVFVVAWLLTVFLIVPSRNIVRRRLARKSWWGIPVVIFGAGTTGTMLVDLLLNNPHHGFKPAIVLDDDPAKYRLGDSSRPPVFGGLDLATPLSKRYNIHYAIVAMPGVPSPQLTAILQKHAHQFPHFLLIPDLFGVTSLWVTAKDLGGVLGLEIQQNLIRRSSQMTKSFLDLLLVIAGGCCLLPLLILLAIAVKLTSKGPVFYSQTRIGKNERKFRTWKFRSMVPLGEPLLRQYLDRHPELLNEWKANHKLRHDPRVTPVGRLLRKTSLDELPQLWNVLRGDMSLVGPRPILETEMIKYGASLDLYLQVKPGITGLWQVSGRNNTSFQERVKFDEYYVRNWSVWMDLYILGRTIKTVILAEGAY